MGGEARRTTELHFGLEVVLWMIIAIETAYSIIILVMGAPSVGRWGSTGIAISISSVGAPLLAYYVHLSLA